MKPILKTEFQRQLADIRREIRELKAEVRAVRKIVDENLPAIRKHGRQITLPGLVVNYHGDVPF